MQSGIFGSNPGTVLLCGASVAFYIGSRVCVDALVGSDKPQPGRRAVGHWLPVALVALIATAMRRPEIALSVIFATSVAGLSLVMGSVAVVAPLDAPAGRRRAWPFVLPAGLITLLAGFHGRLEWYHALMLILEGVAILIVWDEGAREETPPVIYERSGQRTMTWRVIQGVLAVGLCIGGAWVAVKGTIDASQQLGLSNGGPVGTLLLAPMLALPMIAAGSTLAHHGRAWESAGTHVGMVFLNLCVALPMVILLWHVLVMGGVPSPEMSRALHYPLSVWRVDSVFLVLLGFLLLPAGLGRWVLGRYEGVALVVGYVLYMWLAIAATW